MIQITRHYEPSRGEALAIKVEPIAWLPVNFGRMTPAQIAAVYTTWEDGDGAALEPEAVLFWLVAKGLLSVH